MSQIMGYVRNGGKATRGSPFLLYHAGCIPVSRALSLKTLRALKDRNILSLYLVPAHKGRTGSKEGRTVRENHQEHQLRYWFVVG